MTRARNNAEARTTTDTKSGADARARRQRGAASVRLQVCANVFARSRIHFDASRCIPAAFAASDVAPALAQADDRGDEDPLAAETPAGNDEFTSH